MERERACILEAQEREEQYERNQKWENKPIIFRPSTHYFRLLKVEQEASKQKMFARAHENRLAKEEQHRRDYEKYMEQVKIKIDREIAHLRHCQQQELDSAMTKANARCEEIEKLRQQDWEKHTKSMNAKLADLRHDQQMELNKDYLAYKVLPQTRPACDYNTDATTVYQRSISKDQKITGKSAQTTRSNHQMLLGHSVSGSFVQHNTSRLEIAADQLDSRFTIKPRPNISEQYTGHNENRLTRKDVNTKHSFYHERCKSAKCAPKHPETPANGKTNWNQFNSPARPRTPCAGKVSDKDACPKVTAHKTQQMIEARAAVRKPRATEPGLILSKPYRRSLKRHSYQYRFHNPELCETKEHPHLPVDVEVESAH
jgi:hypothetical protein